MESLLNLLRDRLSAVEQSAFDQLAKKHDLKVGYDIAKYMAENMNGEKEFFANFQARIDGPQSNAVVGQIMASGCFKEFASERAWMRTKKGCELVCTNK